MNRNAAIRFTAVGIVMLAVFGCADKEVVKKDEPIVPTAEKAKTVAPAPAATKTTPAVPTTKSEQAKPLMSKVPEAAAITASFESIYFDFDKSDLSPAARSILTKNADAILKGKSDVKVRIEGNCDERGSAEYNLALGERRAKSALQYLMTLGVPAERLVVLSYGKEHPAVSGNNESAWAKNRRDDFVILK